MFGDDPENTVRKMKEVIEDVTVIVIDDWAKCVEMEVDKIRQRLDALEVASRKANTEQPLVSPPSQSTESPAALARPECLTKLVSYVEMRLGFFKSIRTTYMHANAIIDELEEINEQLVTYDQGPLAEVPTANESQASSKTI